MGINLPDLIVESIIRDGLEYLRQNPDVVDDIFSELIRTYASRKYGQTEIEKIKTLLQEKNIAVVHSFHEADAKSPCYSIQLGTEMEAKERAHLGDFEADVREELTEEELEAFVKINPFIPDTYDPLTGKVTCDNAFNLSTLHPGYLWEDADGNEFQIKRGISNVTGDKYFFIEKNQEPNMIEPGLVKSFIHESQHEEKGDVSAVNMLLGVHAKNPLTTKYLYTILKYIMKSRKKDLIRRGIENSTFQGSDFTRDLRYEGDMVYTRFFTLSGQVADSWRSDNVDLIDAVEIDAHPVDCACAQCQSDD